MHESQKQIQNSNSSSTGANNGLYKKRERTQNWAHQEKKFLLELCRKDMLIIENKRLDATLTAVKNKAWKIIHQKFSTVFGTDRTCNRLKEQWRRMKACTRNEIMDYNNRLMRYGQDVADRKKPSAFTFEIWEFMQEAKRACKSEALDNFDYSNIPLTLEKDSNKNDDDSINHTSDSTSSYKNENIPSNILDVHIKEESNSNDNGIHQNDNDDDENDDVDNDDNNNNEDESIDRTSMSSSSWNFESNNKRRQQQNDNINDLNMPTINLPSSFSLNNFANSFGALNAFRNFSLQYNNSNQCSSEPQKKRSRVINNNDDYNNFNYSKEYMDMQMKEHLLRMNILEIQLQAAKFNRDVMEINKAVALQKLHDATKQFNS